MDTLNTIIEVAAILFALLGGFIMHYLLSRNETIIERLGLDYHCLRSTLHLFNYKPLYENPDKSKKILAPILDYLAYVCQLWYISAVQGSHLRKNVLEAQRIFGHQEELKEHFLDTAKKLDESQGKVRALPSGLFEFVLVILIILTGITLSGVWFKLIFEPYMLASSFNLLFFVFYAALSFFFVLFFFFIYDLKRLDAFCMCPRVYDLLKWLFIRCLIFASTDKKEKTTEDYKKYKKNVSEYLKKVKIPYDEYSNLGCIQNDTRRETLDKAEEIAEQFLKKRKKRHEDREKKVDHKKWEKMKEDWEEEKVEWTVPRAATEVVLGWRFKGVFVLFIMVFSGLLICAGCPWVIRELSYILVSQSQLLLTPKFFFLFGFKALFAFLSLLILNCWAASISGLVLLWVVIAILVGLLILLFHLLVGEGKTPSFLKDLHKYWDVIIRIEQNYEMEKNQQVKDIQKKKVMYKKIKNEVKEGIKECMKKDT